MRPPVSAGISAGTKGALVVLTAIAVGAAGAMGLILLAFSAVKSWAP